MEKEKWLEAWKVRQIGFHQSTYNKVMMEHFDQIDLKEKTVFIPLAGKTLDILYFLERGAKVIAIELSPIAASEFFEENKIEYSIKKNTHHKIFQTKNLTYYLGDFFSLSKNEVSQIDYLYDRASVVALPHELRVKYFNKIDQLITKRTHLFILTYKHDGKKDFGPPFYVPEDELSKAYEDMGHQLQVSETSTQKAEGRFADAGMSKLTQLKWHSNI